MLPQVFLERMQGLLGSEYEEFLVSFDHEKYQALRLNPLKLRTESGRTDDSTVIEEKYSRPFVCIRFPGRTTAITTQKRTSRENIPGMKRDFIIFRNPVPWHL